MKRYTKKQIQLKRKKKQETIFPRMVECTYITKKHEEYYSVLYHERKENTWIIIRVLSNGTNTSRSSYRYLSS